MTAAPILEVAKHELDNAWRRLVVLVRGVRKPMGEAMLSYWDGKLEISCSGIAVSVPARGTWPGQARVPGQFIVGLAKVPPAGDPVTFRVEGDRLSISTLSVVCTWQQPAARTIHVPVNPSLTWLLSLPLHYTGDEIGKAALAGDIQTAQARGGRLIARALTALKPFGVLRDDLAQLVFKSIERQHPKA